MSCVPLKIVYTMDLCKCPCYKVQYNNLVTLAIFPLEKFDLLCIKLKLFDGSCDLIQRNMSIFPYILEN